MMAPVSTTTDSPRRFNPLLVPFTSIRFGLACVFVLLVYMSIGSAIPAFRQHPLFDMTEFEWFHTRLFVVLILLVCVNLTSITIRRIPLSTLTLGVWMIHTGVVWLCLSSAYYFLMKVEGDAPVLRRAVTITTGDGLSATLPVIPGASTQLGETFFLVTSVDPRWPLLSGEDEGKLVLSINVGIQTPERRFIRQVLVGYPQYTEDIIPGEGRAIKSTGERLLDDSLVIEPEYLAQEWFYIKDSRALYARVIGDDGSSGDWIMYTLDDLPRYSDVVGDGAEVVAQSQGTGVLRGDLSISPHTDEASDPLGLLGARVTGYLRYAFLQSRLHPGERRVTISIPETGFTIEADSSKTFRDTGNADYIPIGETGYAYRLGMFADDFVSFDGHLTPLLGLDIRTPEAEFSRLLSSDGTMLVDFELGRFSEENTLEVDERVEVDYDHGGHIHGVPAIVGNAQRDRGAGVLFSMISLETSAGSHAATWLPYHQYVWDSGQYVYPGRFRHAPSILSAPDGTRVEVMFSRERRRLPSPVVLDHFELTPNVGGFTGQQASIRDWTSHIRFDDGNGWGPEKTVSTNRPAEHGGLWYFQASWDPPQQNSAGFLFTGLGVGNRHGVYQMLASSTLAVIGMCYAFYVKPVIRRRRIDRVHAQVAAQKTTAHEKQQDDALEEVAT